MILRSFFLNSLISFIIIFSVINDVNAQNNEKNRINIEFGTGLSNFKNIKKNSSSLVRSMAITLWSPSSNIYALDAFVTGYYDFYSDISVLYGKMLPFKNEKKRFVSIHGGIGYVLIHRHYYDFEINTRTLGLSAQLKAGWAFDKAWLGLIIFQKISFTKGNNIIGVNLNYSLNLNEVIPK